MRSVKISVFVMLSVFLSASTAKEIASVCYGETHEGSIKNSAQLPSVGPNFKVYSQLGWYLGRTFVHSKVAEVVLDSYASMAEQLPEHRFIYGETGWPYGGEFKPHKTHQNGLSVDFMVPVVDHFDVPQVLPVAVLNKYGYAIEFNEKGVQADLRIDFNAMAKHIKSLDLQAKSHGFGITRVIFAPNLQPLLLAAVDGGYLQQHITFNGKQAWVRHDEHYHVDFAINCEPILGK